MGKTNALGAMTLDALDELARVREQLRDTVERARELADTWDRMADEYERESKCEDVPMERVAKALTTAGRLRLCAQTLRALLVEREA